MTPKEFYTIYLQHPQVSTDSRKTIPGCLFFALKGEKFDGNLFVADALDKGCRYAIVDDPAALRDDRCIRVPDVLVFLQELAACHREHLSIPVVALTGTNGKTTTKELIQSVLKREHRVVATPGNLNNHIGVPLTLLSAAPGTEILVVEMGANHPGEIRLLAEIARPTHGLITNIGKAHLAGFGTLEGVVRAKSELFEFIRESRGHWFLNTDDPLLKQMIGDYPAISYGTDQTAMVRGSESGRGMYLNPTLYLPDGSSFITKTNLTGSYNLCNVLASVAVGHHFGLSRESIRKGIEGYIPQNLRSQWIDTGRNRLFMDAYNANPSSMLQAIRVFHSLDLPGKVLILGDMFELGQEAESEHRAIINLLRDLNFISVYLVGPEFLKIASGSQMAFFPGMEDLIRELTFHPLKGRTILIKGSRGMQLEKIADYL